MAKPKLVGVWVAACSPQGDLIKWGKDGDTVMPHKTTKAALNQAQRLAASTIHQTDRFYLLNVFNNGQIRTDEI